MRSAYLRSLQLAQRKAVRNYVKSSLLYSAPCRSAFVPIPRLSIANSRCLSSKSSFAEPEQTLFHADRDAISKDSVDLDKQLRSDVKSMGSILGKYVKTMAFI